MRIIHLINPYEKWARSMSVFFDDNFSNQEIMFISKKEKDKDFLCFNDLNIKQQKFLYEKTISIKDCYKLKKILSKYDKIILHTIPFSSFYEMYFTFFKSLMRKFVWISTGADLYRYDIKKKNTISPTIKLHYNTKFRKNVSFFVGIFPPDIDVFKQKITTKVPTLYVPYCCYSKKHPYEFISRKIITSQEKYETNQPLIIQIGHSSDETVKHKEILDDLVRFSNENIKIILPLSYGDKDYANKIENYAKELFKDKAICLRNFMPFKEYSMQLASIDIFLSKSLRQIGLGNINPLLYYKKKIFLPSKSVMFKFFTNNGIDINNYDTIDDLNFIDFIKQSESDIGKEYIINHYDGDNNYRRWNNLFIELEKNI